VASNFSLVSGIHGLSPWQLPARFSSLYNLTCGRRSLAADTNFPLSRARVQENGTNLKIGGWSQKESRSVHLDPSGL